MTEQEKRIARAQTAVKAYYDGGAWGSYDEIIGDLLADLMHYVDALRTDRELEEDTTFDDLLATAEMHYNAEINGED